MLVYDTDTLSDIQNESPLGLKVRDRVLASGQPDAVTIVTVGEQLDGRLSYAAKASTPEQYLKAMKLLRGTFDDLRFRTVLDFDAGALVEFERPALSVTSSESRGEIQQALRSGPDFRLGQTRS